MLIQLAPLCFWLFFSCVSSLGALYDVFYNHKSYLFLIIFLLYLFNQCCSRFHVRVKRQHLCNFLFCLIFLDFVFFLISFFSPDLNFSWFYLLPDFCFLLDLFSWFSFLSLMFSSWFFFFLLSFVLIVFLIFIFICPLFLPDSFSSYFHLSSFSSRFTFFSPNFFVLSFFLIFIFLSWIPFFLILSSS